MFQKEIRATLASSKKNFLQFRQLGLKPFSIGEVLFWYRKLKRIEHDYYNTLSVRELNKIQKENKKLYASFWHSLLSLQWWKER